MSASRNRSLRSLAAVASLLSLAAGASASDPLPVKDVGEFACKEIMVLGDDQDVAIAILLGVAMGKSGASMFDGDKLAIVVDKFMDDCTENPKALALDRMKSALAGK